MVSKSTLTVLSATVLLASACGGGTRRFPLREPLTRDTDFRPFNAPCKPDKKDPAKQVCTPEPYESSFAWDGADNIVFRPVARFFAVDPGGEAVNVNAFDEVPDSSWFENRITVREMSLEDIKRGACNEDVLDPNVDPPGSWLIDQGKPNGANPGFRVKTPKGRFFLKADVANQPEKGTAAASIAARFYHAAGWHSPCDSVVYFKPELLSLKPGLMVTDNTGVSRPFDDAALKALLAKATKRGELTRMVASKFLPGIPLGPFTYDDTREDDPNDVIPHEDRRDLRGARVIAAWLNHFDSREQNSMSTWMASNPKAPESSPGWVKHWYLDLGDCFGSEWEWDGITRRLGHAYYLDIPYVVEDFVTLGIIERPWDRNVRAPDGEIFAYFSSKDFKPDIWRGGYPNPSFNRMTELDAAWATRAIARFTRDQIEAAISAGDFTNPIHDAYLLHHLLERQKRILERYFSKLSPIADVAVRDGASLCGVDLARRTSTFEASSFSYSAAMYTGEAFAPSGGALSVSTADDGGVCVPLKHFAADGGAADSDLSRYTVVDISNGSAPGPLRAHLYDLGPAKGFKLVGIERPRSASAPSL